MTRSRTPSLPQIGPAGAAALALLLAASVSAALAQDAPAKLVLDPDAAAQLAIRNSLQLRVDAQSVEQAEARLRQALALNNPTLSASASLLYRGPKPALPPEFSSFFVEVVHTETLTASKPLWTAGKLEAQRLLARKGIEVADSQAAVTRLALARLARDAVLGLHQDERLLDVDYRTLAGLLEHQRVTEKRYREGLIAFFEVTQAQAQSAAQERAIGDRLRDVEQDRVDLRRLLAVDQATPIAVSVGSLPERPEGALDQVIASALERRPEMVQARRQIELAEAGLRVTRRSLRPTVSVSAQLQGQSTTLVSSPAAYQVVLAFEQPILDGGRKDAQVREQVARSQAARFALEALAQQVAQEVAVQCLKLDPIARQIAAAQIEERSALEQLRISRLRFSEDLGLGEEVIVAQAAVARAQTGRINAQSDLHLALLRLRAAMGLADLQEAEQP